MKQTEAGKRLQAAREAVTMGLDEAAVRAKDAHQGLKKCSRETIRRYEQTAAEETWNPNIILALSIVYGVHIRDLSPLAADSVVSVLELVGAEPGGTWTFPCNPQWEQLPGLEIADVAEGAPVGNALIVAA